MGTRLYQKAAATLLSVLVLAGCGSVKETASTSAGVNASESSQPVTVVVALPTEPLSMNPQNDATTQTTNMHLHMFETLTRLSEKMEVIPGLAESWAVISPTEYEFKLRKGVKFHNGSLLTAQDVKFTLDRIRSKETKPESVWQSRMRWITGVSVVDEYTVRVKMDEPNAPGLSILAYSAPILPKEYFEKVGDEGFNNAPVGTGPYKFVKWERNSAVTMEAYPDYWGEKPRIGTLVWRTIPDAFTRISELKAGGVDIIGNVPPSQIAALADAKNAQIAPVKSLRILFMGFNAKAPPFNDVRVRQAVNHAVDVDAIIKTVMGGRAYRNNGPVPGAAVMAPQHTPAYAYDPEKAKNLLAEAGYANGFKMVIDSPQGRYAQDKETAEAVAAYLRKVGIDAEVRTAEWAVYWDKYLKGQVQYMYVVGCGEASGDGHSCVDLHLSTASRGILYGHGSTDLDKLITAGKVTLDTSERKKIYASIADKVNKEAPWLFLYDFEDVYAYNTRVTWTPRSDERIDLTRAAVSTK